MRITSGGEIGIGTTSVSAKVQIHSTNAGQPTIPLFIVNKSTDTNTEARLGFAAHTNDDVGTNRYSYISTINTSGSNGQDMIFATNPTGSAASERMRINSSGLISFNGSGQTLNMNIPGSQRQQLELSGGLSNEFNFNNSSNTGTDTISFSDPDGDNAGKISYSHNTDSLSFITNSSERITIDSSGQVGISATTPISQLDVSGNINQRHSASTTNNGAFKNIQNLGVAGWLDQTASAGRIKVYGYENGNVNVSYCEYYVIRSSTGYHIQQIGTRLDVGNTNGHIEVQVSGNFLQVRNVAQSSLGIVRVVFSGMKN